MNKFTTYPIIACVVLCAISFTSQAQQNLVPNSGFEDYDDCPDDDSEIQVVNHWFSPNTKLPDYFNECAENTNIFYAVPDNEFGSQEAIGEAYMGIHNYIFGGGLLADHREYVSVELMEPLVQGNVYCVSYKTNLADESQFAIDQLGLFLSTEDPRNLNLFEVNPQVFSSSNDLLNTEEWRTTSDNFIATGGERFLTIGNFKDDESTNRQYVNPNGLTSSAYYFIDDVIVLESVTQNIGIDLGIDDTICEPSKILSLEQDFAKYVWQDNTTTDSYVATTTGLYTVSVEDACGNVTQDSINLTFNNCSDLCLKFPNTFTPNGDGHNDFFKGRVCEVSNLTFKVFNRWGELIFVGNSPQEAWDGTYANEAQPIGTYLWSVEYVDPNGVKQQDKGFINLLR